MNVIKKLLWLSVFFGINGFYPLVLKVSLATATHYLKMMEITHIFKILDHTFANLDV